MPWGRRLAPILLHHPKAVPCAASNGVAGRLGGLQNAAQYVVLRNSKPKLITINNSVKRVSSQTCGSIGQGIYFRFGI